MNTNQAINYLATVSDIDVRDMSKAMFRFLRAAARCANREYPGMAGYYDPEFEGARAEPARFRFAPATLTSLIPQSARLQAAIAKRFPAADPFANALALILG